LILILLKKKISPYSILESFVGRAALVVVYIYEIELWSNGNTSMAVESYQSRNDVGYVLMQQNPFHLSHKVENWL
jgi:hypothetical protein